MNDRQIEVLQSCFNLLYVISSNMHPHQECNMVTELGKIIHEQRLLNDEEYKKNAIDNNTKQS